jgi:hypothetical protein
MNMDRLGAFRDIPYMGTSGIADVVTTYGVLIGLGTQEEPVSSRRLCDHE